MHPGGPCQWIALKKQHSWNLAVLVVGDGGNESAKIIVSGMTEPRATIPSSTS
jgi:hypothetical protein